MSQACPNNSVISSTCRGKEDEKGGKRDEGEKKALVENNLLCGTACLRKCASTVGGPECPDAERNFTN